MSVLIKGMEMPKSCLHGGCPIDGASCSLWDEKYWKSPDEPYRKRHPKCPLIPVPPHGRLIDADALRQAMYHEAFETDSPMQKWDSGCWIRYKLFERMEEAAPTIIPAEEGE